MVTIKDIIPLAARVPFRIGFLNGDLRNLESVRLAGSKCSDCSIVLFGERHRCENCSSKNITSMTFRKNGVVFSYTVQRYAPPKPNACPDPWVPRPLAWIDLDDGGPRIMAPVDCDPNSIAIGSAVTLCCEAGWTDHNGCEVVAYKFLLASAQGAGSANG